MFLVVEQVAQNLDEVRFTATEETADPYADLAGGVGAAVQGLAVGGEELPQVLVELPGDDKLIQLLPDRRFVQLVGLHDTVDRPENILLEQVLDLHENLSQSISRNAR